MQPDRKPAGRQLGPLARAVAWAVGTAGLVGLAACGGSVAIGFGYDDFDDRPPRASLAVSPGVAAPGQAVRLVAAASDDYGVDAVEFYRLDAGGATLIAVDGQSPFQADTALPSDATGSVQFFARAIDGDNQRGDSAVVAVGVVR